MAITILYREELKEYDFGPGHPFRGDRYQIFPKFLREHLPEDDNYRMLKSEWATEKDLSLICQKEYIDFVGEYYKAAHFGYLRHLGLSERANKFLSGDNIPPGKPGKLEEAARLIIGQAKLGCDLVQKGEFKKVVSLGGGMHHASRDYGDGFCIYNDVAFAAKYLIEKYGLERILILDTDAHAGNGKSVHTGTCGYFYSNPKILFIDLHQDPRTIYPGAGFASDIGEGQGKGFTINIPLPTFASDDSYRLVFEEIVEPVVKEFKPQIIIRNGGSDPHFADDLTQLGLTTAGFRMIGEKVKKLSKICQGKEIDLIASGYNKEILPYAWLALLSGLSDWTPSSHHPIEIKEPISIPQRFQRDPAFEDTKKVIAEVKKNLKDYWKCFK